MDWTDNYRVAANELGSPKVLLCPTDKEKYMAASWGALDAERHVSSFVGLDASDSNPQSILAGDRNLGGGGGGNELRFEKDGSINAMFAERMMHGAFGYIVLSDASVHRVNNAQLREQISASLSVGDTNAVVIVSLPRGIP
jgi:hypothetical protein